jgi:hypothetical protein
LARFLKLAQQAMLAMTVQGDPTQAAHAFGKALMVMPESYFRHPDFYAREGLSLIGRKLAASCKNLDVKRLNRRITAEKAGTPAPPAGD